MEEDTKKYFPEDEAKEDGEEKVSRKLSKPEFMSLLLILGSVALWYMGYNAVTSKYSLYAEKVLNQNYDLTLMIAQGAAIISYIPVGMIATKIGRRKTILAGVVMLATAFFFAIFMTDKSTPVLMYVLFALAGIGWATINVNSFPMVVELAKEGDVGKYTGWYYTASMSAQVLTPVLSGAIMDIAGNMLPLFPYAAICVALAFVTMFFVKHGDSKPVAKKSALENFDIDD
jgi:MFS family permease